MVYPSNCPVTLAGFRLVGLRRTAVVAQVGRRCGPTSQ